MTNAKLKSLAHFAFVTFLSASVGSCLYDIFVTHESIGFSVFVTLLNVSLLRSILGWG